MMKTFFLMILMLLSNFLLGQSVGIGTTKPDSSAVLDISAPNKGLLIPRTDTSSIANPAEGLMIYDPSKSIFFYYTRNKWRNIANSTTTLEDGDGDTSVEVENNPDNDEIVFSVNGVTKFVIDSSGFYQLAVPFSVFIGRNAGQKAVNLPFDPANVFIGGDAGKESDGNSNTFLGTSSGRSSTSGCDNTFVGTSSGRDNRIGSRSVAIGLEAARNDTSMFDSVYLGTYAGRILNGSQISRNGNVFIGYNSGYNNIESNRLIIANSDDSTPLIYGQFDDDQLTINGNLGVGVKEPSDEFHVTDVDESGGVLGRFSTADSELIIGYNTGNQGILGTQTDHDLRIRTNNQNRFTIKNTGKIGIGTSFPSHQLQLSTNSAAKPTSSSWTVVSDQRLKRDISNFNDGLNIIQKINPVWYTYTGRAGLPQETGVGTLAQELQKIAPYMVDTWQDENSDSKEEYLAVDYGAMDFILINAIKEQQEMIKKLESGIKEQKKMIKKLESRIIEHEKQL